jgi:hypothetical protein
MARSKTNRKPPLTQRDDLVCSVCGETFAGHVATRYCPTCREAKQAEEKSPPEPPTGSEMEVEAVATTVPDRDPAYRKQIHVDPDRQRFDRRRRDPGDRSAARTKAADAIAKESPEERRRKEPLRAELAELQRKRDGHLDEAARLDQEILRLLDKIGLPAEGERLSKACFGQFDPNDFECTDLCPLRPECEVRAGRGALVADAEPTS